MWRGTDPYPYTCCVENIKCCHQYIGCSSRLPSSIKCSCRNEWKNLHDLLLSGFFYRRLPNTIVGRNGLRIVIFLPKIELSIKLTPKYICSGGYTVFLLGSGRSIFVIGCTLSVRLSVRLHTETVQVCTMVRVKLRRGREYINHRSNLNKYESR